MSWQRLLPAEQLHHGAIHTFEIEGRRLLLTRQNDDIFLLENKCGHFGTPMDTGTIRDGVIICPNHGISFSLRSGEVVNRPYENCVPIKVFAVDIRGQWIGVDLSADS